MTYEKDPVIASLAARARDQIGKGLACVLRGDHIAAESWLRPALSTLESLNALLDAEPQKPLRKIALVRASSGEEVEIEAWMATKHDGGDGAA